jgi:lipopolysaccharide biosynthesis glycosyltransferase
MIHLDGDTIVFKDLWEMFNLPFNDNYFLAQPTIKDIFKDKVLKQNAINVGVVLFNIKKFREDNKDFKLLYYLFIKKFTEQILMEYICIPKIGYLPFKYGILFIGDINFYISHYQSRMVQKVNLTEFEEAMKDPTIVHDIFCSPKHWKKRTKARYLKNFVCYKYQGIFYHYAKKTKYYQVIYNKYMK